MTGVLFTEGHSLKALAIKYGTLSPISHVAITLDGGYLLHAHGKKGVTIEPRSEWHETPLAEFQVLPDVTYEVSRIEQQVGRKYDYLGIFEHIMGRLGAVVGTPLRRIWGPIRPGIHCAALVLELDRYGEIPEWAHLDPLTVTPADLYENMGPSFVRIA